MTINNQPLDLSGTNLLLDTLLYQGTSSTIYKCFTNDVTKKPMCVKKKDIAQAEKILGKEVKLIQVLKGITPAFQFAYKTSDSVLIITELVGLSLHEHFVTLKKNFSLPTIALIGLNTLTLLEQIHSRGLIHGNLTPKKILTDKNPNNSNLYLTGLSSMKKFKNDKGEHIRFRERFRGEEFTINNFSSGNKHLGRLSRRDDIESLAYILLYFDTKGEIFDNHSQMFRGQDLQIWKASTAADKLYPKATTEFVKLLHYAKGLGFEERPDYDKIRSFFKQILSKADHKNTYDWNMKSQVNQKRKNLYSFLQFEQKQGFPTIVEEQLEESNSCILDLPSPQKYFTGDPKVDLSPPVCSGYEILQRTVVNSKFLRQPNGKDRSPKPEDIAAARSPWNCSDIADDMQPILEKVQSMQFKTTLGIICGSDGKYLKNIKTF